MDIKTIIKKMAKNPPNYPQEPKLKGFQGKYYAADGSVVDLYDLLKEEQEKTDNVSVIDEPKQEDSPIISTNKDSITLSETDEEIVSDDL